MKNTRNFLFTLLALSITSVATAQFSGGIRSGLTWTNVHETDLLDVATPEFEAIRSFQIAAVGEYAFSDLFSLQTEVGYSGKGFAYRQGTDIELFEIPLPVGVRAEARFSYLEVPLLAKLKFGGEKLQAFVQAGPHIGYAVDGKLVTRTDGIIELDLTSTDINLESIGYQQLELGATLGAGLSYDAGFSRLFVNVRYQHGFTGLYDLPLVDEMVRNRGFGLNAGFLVPFGG